MKLPPPTVIIFGTKMANSPKLCEVHRALNFHLTKLMSMHYRVKRRCSKLLHNAVINSIRTFTIPLEYCSPTMSPRRQPMRTSFWSHVSSCDTLSSVITHQVLSPLLHNTHSQWLCELKGNLFMSSIQWHCHAVLGDMSVWDHDQWPLTFHSAPVTASLKSVH